MAYPHKASPSGVRLTRKDRGLAKKAAHVESLRLKRRIGWTTLIADGGMTKVRRILKRAEKAKVVA
jgi:hypothetical protein